MEELFSLMTMQTYPCNNDSIFETWKRHCTDTPLGDWLWWSRLIWWCHYTVGKKPLQEM